MANRRTTFGKLQRERDKKAKALEKAEKRAARAEEPPEEPVAKAADQDAVLGADVVKVEPPGGDPMRGYPALFASLSANKRSLVLDLKDEAGRRRALELAAEADVVIEAFRPGVAARLGVGYEDVRAVNPS